MTDSSRRPLRAAGWRRLLGAAVTVAGVALAVAAAPGAEAAPLTAAAPPTTFVDRRVEFEPGANNAWRESWGMPGVTDRWFLTARAGQTFAVTIDSADNNHVFSVFAPDRTLLVNISADQASPTTFWTGVLPADGDYQIEVTTQGGPLYYQLKAWVDAPAMDPLGLVQRVPMRGGRGTGRGSVIRASVDSWLVTAEAGRTLHVNVDPASGAAPTTFDVYQPDGTMLTAPGPRTEWHLQLPMTGDYRIAVAPQIGNADYTVRVSFDGAGNQARRDNDVCDSEIECPPGADDGFCDQYGCGDPIYEPDDDYYDDDYCDEYGCGDPIYDDDGYWDDSGEPPADGYCSAENDPDCYPMVEY